MAASPDPGYPVGRRGLQAGRLVRRGLPVEIIVPLVAAGLSLGGEAAGWYGVVVAVGLVAVAAAMSGTFVVLRAAGKVARLEQDRAVAYAQLERGMATLQASQARFAALVEHSSDVIAVFDESGRATYLSPAVEKVLGYRPEADRTSVVELIHPDDRGQLIEEFAALAREPGAVRTLSPRARHADGEWRQVEVVATNRLHDASVRGIVANVRDVSERIRAAERLRYEAFHDSLTGLPNRALLVDRISHALDRAKRSGTRTALLFIDLDRFKTVNDTFGHDTGDLLLIEVAARLVGAVRAADTVGRLGGDEFLVLTEAVVDTAEVERMAERINRRLADPFELPGGQMAISASIGIAFDEGHNATSLLRDADTALYRAKERGRDRYQVFTPALRAAVARRIATEQLLRQALDTGGLVVHFQPIVDLTGAGVVATEALVRVRTASGELRAPGGFIDVADESGLIVPIGAEVVDQACAQLAAWRRAEGVDAPARMTINVAASQLSEPGFVHLLTRALHDHGLVPGDLVLELTEMTFLSVDRATMAALAEVHRLGVALAIDDFGTGYSSLAYLKRFPIDWVKLDRTFVAGIDHDVRDSEIVRAVVALGRSLDLVVIAEGIETAAQLERVQELGCDCGQGFLLARPAPPEELPAQQEQVTAVMA